MFSGFRRCCSIQHWRRPLLRYYSANATRAQEVQPDIIHHLENQGGRILRVVARKVSERNEALAGLSEDMSSPEDIKRVRKARELEPLSQAWDEWTTTKSALQETTALLSDNDPSMRAMAEEEYSSLSSSLANMIETTFSSLLTPVSETAELSALMELKSGVGGSEASLFLADLLRMYMRHANAMRWKTQIVSQNDLEGGGIKDAVVEFKGHGVYDQLRWESGVHRVQRVPATEASGRVHTSTVAIVVLPLEEEGKSETEDDLFSMSDVKIEVMRARGAGGQHVNKTESAVRLTHIPTGITVSMQDERSQHQNRRRAFNVLRARLLDIKIMNDQAQRRATRQNLVKGADRSEKIRTYNYAQDRVTDHRIGLSLMNLTSVMEGEGLQDFLSALKKNHEETLMEEMLEEA